MMQGIPWEGEMDGIFQVNWRKGVWARGGWEHEGSGWSQNKKRKMTLILCLISLELDLLFSCFLGSRPHLEL